MAGRLVISPARRAAVASLLAIERGHTTLSTELDRARRGLADPRDRALLFELTAGTLRWQASIDALLEARSRRALADLDPRVRAALRTAVFQLEHTRLPHRAVVHEAVELIKLSGVKSAAGFVNAVLRAVLAGRDDPRPVRPGLTATRDEQLAYLSTTLSFPSWLAGRWLDRFGFDGACRWCEFCNETPRPTLRYRPGLAASEVAERLRAVGVNTRPAEFASHGLVVTEGHFGATDETRLPGVVVQDEASQLVGALTASVARRSSGGEAPKVLDLCAAPGGKSLLLADVLPPNGLIVASDYRPARVKQLARSMAGAERVRVVRLDGGRPLPFGPAFATVLLDAPCSGLGTIRRDPDVKWARREADLEAFSARQRRLAQRASEAVAPGGALVYATCSTEPEENEAVVQAMVATGFEIRPALDFLDFATSREHGVRLASCVTEAGFLTTRPDRHGLDAFFAAVLVRPERP